MPCFRSDSPRSVFSRRHCRGPCGAGSSDGAFPRMISRLRAVPFRAEFTIRYQVPPSPDWAQNIENTRFILRLCARPLSLQELHAKSREHGGYADSVEASSPTLELRFVARPPAKQVAFRSSLIRIIKVSIILQIM
jgi:hypothetical protein